MHERERKGSTDTTQKIEIYFNLLRQFIPPSMQEKEPTPEELEEIRKKEARKDRLHRNYLRRKANGQQKAYEKRTKAQKKAERAKDRENGGYYIVSDAGPEIPKAEKRQPSECMERSGV